MSNAQWTVLGIAFIILAIELAAIGNLPFVSQGLLILKTMLSGPSKPTSGG